MIFHGFTLKPDGRIRSRRQHDSSSLEPAAVEIFAQMLQRCGPDFQHAIPVGSLDLVSLDLGGQVEAARETAVKALGPMTLRVLLTALLLHVFFAANAEHTVFQIHLNVFFVDARQVRLDHVLGESRA